MYKTETVICIRFMLKNVERNQQCRKEEVNMQIIPWDEINGELGHEQKMKAFLTKETDTFAILQLKEIDETEDRHFLSLGELKRMDTEPQVDHYEIVYTGPLPLFENRDVFLEDTFRRFNID